MIKKNEKMVLYCLMKESRTYEQKVSVVNGFGY